MTWLTKAVLGEENFISATKRPTQPYRGRSIFLRGERNIDNNFNMSFVLLCCNMCNVFYVPVKLLFCVLSLVVYL
jgi:hypothetical protein